MFCPERRDARCPPRPCRRGYTVYRARWSAEKPFLPTYRTLDETTTSPSGPFVEVQVEHLGLEVHQARRLPAPRRPAVVVPVLRPPEVELRPAARKEQVLSALRELGERARRRSNASDEAVARDPDVARSRRLSTTRRAPRGEAPRLRPVVHRRTARWRSRSPSRPTARAPRSVAARFR